MKILLLFLIFGLNSLFPQHYERIEVTPLKELHEIGPFRYILSYHIDDLWYYIGMDLTSEKTKRSGLRLRVYDSNKNLKFESPGKLDSYTYNPTFFKNNNLTPHTIILVHISNEGSWGQDVYGIDDTQIKYLGKLKISTWAEEPEMYWDIAPYTKITQVNNTIIFSFESSKVVLDPSSPGEKVLNGNELIFEYRDGNLKAVNKS